MKKIFTIKDNDFGDVEVKYCPESKNITADGLTISEVPADYSNEVIMKAWRFFKTNYYNYGVVGATYDYFKDL